MSYSSLIFDTPLGAIGLAWNDVGLVRLQLPETTAALTRERLVEDCGPCEETTEAAAPDWVRDAVARLRRHLETGREDLTAIRLDLSGVTRFQRRVLEAALAVPPGRTVTYGELAQSIGSPNATRAVGQALGRNPLALIIPCHRILAAGQRPGGFSAPGGLDTKRVLLEIEDASTLFRSR
jgi:methylated-DNA-[protein]-cysteine S-methyltransferase